MPSILQAAPASPRGSSTVPFRRNTTREVMLVVRLMALAWALAALTLKWANTVKAIIRKVPVPGP